MIDLTNIFPTNYPDRPSSEEIELVFKEILNRSDSVDMVVSNIEKESCPYYKEVLVRCMADKIDGWYQRQAEIVGIKQGDYWIPYWQKPNEQIEKLIHKYEAEQRETSLITPAPQSSLIPNITQQVKASVKHVVSELKTIKEITQAKTIHITVQMPIYVINGDNNGTLAGQYTNNHLTTN
jgi:hypothetical protein